MSTCARCGLPRYDWRSPNVTPAPTCSAHEDTHDIHLLACRDRQLSNQSALLRSVTAKLEEAADLLEPPNGAGYVNSARQLVVEVLETLA